MTVDLDIDIDIAWAPGGGALPAGFLELPSAVYAADPNWIPEDPTATERAFGAGNGWFQSGEALCLSAPGQARLAVFRSPAMVIDDRAAAFFGFWETTGQPEVDAALFDRAVSWARDRGAVDLYGPIDFSTYQRYRLRTAAEPGAVTFPDEPYNPPGYPALLEGLGFERAYQYLTQIASLEELAPQLAVKREVARRVVAAGYRQEPLSTELWLAHLDELHGLIDATFAHNFAYTPLPTHVFRAKCGEPFVRRACPVTSSMTFDDAGRVAAFCLVYPHYGPLVVQAAGTGRVAVGDLSWDPHAGRLAAHGPRTMLVKTVGVHPAHRRTGISDASVLRAIERGLELGYARGAAATVRADNATRRFSAGLHDAERWYALYRRRLDRLGPG